MHIAVRCVISKVVGKSLRQGTTLIPETREALVTIYGGHERVTEVNQSAPAARDSPESDSDPIEKSSGSYAKR